MTPSDLTGLPDNILRKMVEEARAEAARQALLVQRYEPAYLGLPHVVRERDEARSEAKHLKECNDGHPTMCCGQCASQIKEAKAEVSRLRERLEKWESQDVHESMQCYKDTERLTRERDEARDEVARLEGLILDWYIGIPGDPAATNATAIRLASEARRIRAQREEDGE